MKVALAGGLLIVLATHALAHRLDEYLQAIRVSVATNRVELTIDLTPGVAILPQLLPVIDRDRDGKVSQEEVDAYSRQVLGDLKVRLDGAGLVLKLENTLFPTLPEVREGHGIIRIKASAAIDTLATGAHSLHLTNSHLPGISVYLVNALKPKDQSIRITRQKRDNVQREYQLEFEVDPPTPRVEPIR